MSAVAQVFGAIICLGTFCAFLRVITFILVAYMASECNDGQAQNEWRCF